ncbi:MULTISPECIES: Na+/H+ antiporter subunit E [Corallincola]|uniref:Na+/H+ antiporter subunit E n=2 Tax=Corallincola TaxID=1775176 RepID=A0A368NP27_9GAMM|nr:MULTISPECIES: Na+/H+ antiporter subunit E [Corallincola]RCU51916.1 Na+/H+ antiporter subunit E [Corallincola holothuriorum]TAA47407.1 Na+/H+ antiporter subunit E [Corallincola spongiicola]
MKIHRSFALLPTPFHSLLLWLVWLALNDFSAGHMVLGAFLAIGIPLLVSPLSADEPVAKKPLVALRYFFMVLWDIVVSNIEMMKRVLGPIKRLKPGFIVVPLDLSGELPLTIFTSTISLTPGTVSVEFSEDKKWLYVHALHIDDEQAMVAHIKQRYEQPLKEVFGC